MSLSGRISFITFPSLVIPTAPTHTTRFAMLAGRHLRDRGIASLSQADVERALLSTLPEVADPLLPSIFVDDSRFAEIARDFRARLAAAPTSVQLGHVHARCALAHGLGWESIHALQAVLTGTSPVRVVESSPVRLVINPAGHWTQRGGELVLPDRRPRHPIWYVALADERTGLFLFRLTDSQPEPAGVASLMMRLLVHNGTLPGRVFVAHSLRGRYAEVFRVLANHHIQVLPPPKSGQDAVGHRIQTFLSYLSYLHLWLDRCRESMASCQEIGEAVGPLAVLCVPCNCGSPKASERYGDRSEATVWILGRAFNEFSAACRPVAAR